jgi:hypothetical protein
LTESPKLKLNVVRHRFVEDRSERASGQLHLARFCPVVAHVDAADHVSACVDEEHVAHACVRGADLRHNAHSLGNIDSGSPDVDRAAAGSDVLRVLNDCYLKPGLGQPICSCGAGNARARDQRLTHENQD